METKNSEKNSSFSSGKNKNHARSATKIGNKGANIKCPLCPFRTTKTTYLTRHNRIIHLKERPFSCTQDGCNYSATISSNLSKHLKTHLKEEDRRFPCPHPGCSKRFNQMPYLRTHELVHTQERNYPCYLCDYKGGNNASLNIHMTTHTGEKSLQCKLCNYSTARHGHLRLHIWRFHLKEKLFACNQANCGKSFYSAKELRSHRTIHTGEQNYECEKCTRKFSHISNLARHLKTVHRPPGEKPRRKCPFSGTGSSFSYRCESSSELKSHIQSRHSNERPFSCQLCDYRCKLKRALDIHMKQVHNENKTWKQKPRENPSIKRFGYNLHKCTVCSFCTKEDANLALHLSTAHQLPKVYLCAI